MPNPRGAIVLLTLVVSGLAAWELWPRALVAPAASTQSASPVDRHVDPALHSEPPGQRNALELVHEAETAAPVEGPIAVARTTRPYLQVRVTQAQAPVGGAVVKVWRGRWNDDFLTGTQPPLFVAVTGRDGLARAESTSDELTVAAEFGRARRIANLRGGRTGVRLKQKAGRGAAGQRRF